MKINQLLSGLSIALSNKEQQFIDTYNNVDVNSLSENDLWVAQNLVRKGVYDISNNNTLIKKINET
jgi:hypothetical protein